MTELYEANFIFINDRITPGVYSDYAPYFPVFGALLMLEWAPRVSDLVYVGRGPRIWVSDKFSGDTDGLAHATPFETAPLYKLTCTYNS